MKKLSIPAIAFAATMLFFASCQKDANVSKSEEAQIEQSMVVPEQDNSVDSKNPEEKPSLQTLMQPQKDNLLSPMENRDATLKTRGIDPVAFNYPLVLDYFNAYTIGCGTNMNSTTVNRPNKYTDTYFYNKLGFNSNLDGGDRVFYMNLSQERIVNIYLSNTHKNLAMVLLKGHYVWQNGHIQERFDEIEAYTTSSSTTGDQLLNNHLTAGRYMLVIDSKPLGESSFNLRVTCSPINTSCNNTPGTSIFQDKFDNYNVGFISPQSASWNKWNNNTYDGEVVGGATKILKVDYKENVAWTEQADFILDLGPRTTGNYQLEFDMWLYSNNTANFNIQKYIRTEMGSHFYIGKNGQGTIYLKGAAYKNFTFPTNKWAKVRFDVNLSANVTALYIDGIYKGSWTCTESLQTNAPDTKLFRGLNFLTSTDGLYYINNVCFIKRF